MSAPNFEQDAVVNHVDGPLVVLAGAGSGKTRAIIHRTAELVKSGVSPDDILLVTFSSKAATEMRTRLQRLGCSVDARTWHSLCGRILREDKTEWSTWTVDSRDRAKSKLKEAVGYKGIDWKNCDVGKLRGFIGICKANLWGSEDSRAADLAVEYFGSAGSTAIRGYHRFQRLVEDEMLLTSDDMLVFAHRHLSEGGGVDRWAGRWRYLVQDEAQDANAAQVQIATLLAQGHRNYTVVGDPAQAIYGFRGSGPEFLMRFSEEWSAKTINMHRNYRCASRIVACANVTLDSLPQSSSFPLHAERELEGKVSIVRAADLDDEASRFVDYAKAAHAETGAWSGTTCLFRLNAQSRALEDALIRSKIPYILVGGTSFYERREVKDLLGYLRVAANHGEVLDAVKRSINAPFRFLGAKFVEHVQNAWESAGGDVALAVNKACNASGIKQRQVASAHDWVEMIGAARKILEREEGPRAALDYIVRATKYVEWLEKEEGAESIESSHAANVRELVRMAEQFKTAAELLDYIEETVSAAAKRRETEDSDAVLLMSVHKSKGLEWPRVWIVGANEKILPHAKGDPQEERRIFYVALTRAADELTISYVGTMALRSGVSQIGPSPYVVELDQSRPQLLTLVDVGENARRLAFPEKGVEIGGVQ